MLQYRPQRVKRFIDLLGRKFKGLLLAPFTGHANDKECHACFDIFIFLLDSVGTTELSFSLPGAD